MTMPLKTGLSFAVMGLASLSLMGCSNATYDAPDAETKIQVMNVFSADGLPHAQLPETVVPQEYRLDMRINPDDASMSGVVEIDLKLTEDTSKIWLHAKEMDVSEATLTIDDTTQMLNFNAVPLSDAPSGLAYLSSPTTLKAGYATLRLVYETPFNLALNSAYKVTRGEDNYIVTQMEPLGAREAFPGFDEPKYKVPFTVSITSPSDDVVYANTPTVSTQVMEDGWVKHSFAKTRPLPTYLIAFGVGPYDVVEHAALPPTDIRARKIPLRGLTAREKGEEIKYGLENTAGILEAIEGYFGIPYPYEKLDIIAAPDYAFGAMENPGAIVYREYLMLMDETSALSQRRAYASVHSHEIAHQWFGNLVTPVWWEDIWLNEAFATWMGNKGINLWKPDGNFDRNTLRASLAAMNIDTLSTTRKVREPLQRSENVMDQFDGITYRKGGGVLDMFESYLGADTFQAGKFGYGDETLKSCMLMKDKQATLIVDDKGPADWVMPNENGAGYYRFALDTQGWTALLENLDALNAREVLAIQDSLEAAFRADKVEASVFIKGMQTLALSSEYDVASSAGDWLSWFYEKLPENSRPDVAHLTREMYAKRYKDIVGTDTVEGNLLAPTLAARLVNYGEANEMKAEFAQKGLAYLAGDKDAIAPNLLSRALRAAMQSKDTMGTAEKLLDMARSGSSFEKGAAIGALAQTSNPAIAAMLYDTALVDDETLTGRQATSLISAMMDNEDIGSETWVWLKSNFRTFVSTRVPDVRKGRIPSIASGFCSREHRDDVNTFFTENAAVIPGYERSLAQTLESIELCAALKAAKSEELVEALKALR